MRASAVNNTKIVISPDTETWQEIVMGRSGSRLKNGTQFRERWCARAILLIAGWVAGLMVALPIGAQVISGPVALTGVVRTAAGAPVAGAKVTAIFAGIYPKNSLKFA
jgi:hypothetical protein